MSKLKRINGIATFACQKTLVDSGQITFLNSYQIVVIILQIDPSFPFIIPLQNNHQK